MVYKKPKDLKKWDVFENTNGYLSIIYAGGPEKWKIINYNGSDYKISKSGNQDYKWLGNGFPAGSTFFSNYPVELIEEDRMERYEKIVRNFKNSYKISQEHLLLLIT